MAIARGKPKTRPKPLTTRGLISSLLGLPEELKKTQRQAANPAITARITVIKAGEKSLSAMVVKGKVAAKQSTPIKPSRYA